MNGTYEAAGFILMVRRPQPQFLLMRHDDRWDLPKGHAEENEDNLQTALRETQEETGISAESIQVDPEFRFVIEYRVEGKKRGSYDKRVTYYLGFLEEKPQIVTTEHPDFRWWDWPPAAAIQAKTIDPLLESLKVYFEKFPQRLADES
ncbi:MAG: bis(5'-nucleosyl)-tetraphosphatase [Aureliella sp.]